jgi:hypothetical protein
MYIEARRDRAIYQCDCCKGIYDEPLFTLKGVVRKDYCRRCQEAWLRFCARVWFYLA